MGCSQSKGVEPQNQSVVILKNRQTMIAYKSHLFQEQKPISSSSKTQQVQGKPGNQEIKLSKLSKHTEENKQNIRSQINGEMRINRKQSQAQVLGNCILTKSRVLAYEFNFEESQKQLVPADIQPVKIEKEEKVMNILEIQPLVIQQQTTVVQKSATDPIKIPITVQIPNLQLGGPTIRKKKFQDPIRKQLRKIYEL